MRPAKLAGSILHGIHRKVVMSYDFEVRFDCAGSPKMRPASVAGSILRGFYRNIVMLYDVEVRFDCAGSQKMRPASLASIGAPGTDG